MIQEGSPTLLASGPALGPQAQGSAPAAASKAAQGLALPALLALSPITSPNTPSWIPLGPAPSCSPPARIYPTSPLTSCIQLPYSLCVWSHTPWQQ